MSVERSRDANKPLIQHHPRYIHPKPRPKHLLRIPSLYYIHRKKMIYSGTDQEHYYVYILLCSRGEYYVGLTNDLIQRVTDHAEGVHKTCFTFKRRPVKLVYYETIPFLEEAVDRETQIKKWSRKKKEALIQQDSHKLYLLSECQNLSHSRYRNGL